MYTFPSVGQGSVFSVDADRDNCLSTLVLYVSVFPWPRSEAVCRVRSLPFTPAVVPWTSVATEIAQQSL